MPEDDRFSKSMPKGCKGAYIHARAGHSELAVARGIASGIARQMKNGSFVLNAVLPMLTALEQALNDTQHRRGELFHPIDEIRVTLHQTLEGIALRHGLGASARILREVAQYTFERLHAEMDLKASRVQTAFCDELTRTLADYWCFAVPVDGVTARQEIMRRNQRDENAQTDFEQRVCDALDGFVEGLVKQAIRSVDGKPKRTPRLPKPLPRFKLTEMHLPMATAEVQ